LNFDSDDDGSSMAVPPSPAQGAAAVSGTRGAPESPTMNLNMPSTPVRARVVRGRNTANNGSDSDSDDDDDDEQQATPATPPPLLASAVTPEEERKEFENMMEGMKSGTFEFSDYEELLARMRGPLRYDVTYGQDAGGFESVNVLVSPDNAAVMFDKAALGARNKVLVNVGGNRDENGPPKKKRADSNSR
jgi:hypothetical protein